MKREEPQLRLAMGCGTRFRGHWAGCLIDTDFPAPGLAISSAARTLERGRRPGPETSRIATTGFLAGAIRRFEGSWHGPLALLEISGIGRLQIGLDSGHAAFLEPPQDKDAAALALTGPCLALLMAAHGRYMLHASAIEWEGGATVLLGESGAGKSTLASFFEARQAGCRIADDLVVCEDTPRGPIIPGPLPQPRIPECYAEHPTLEIGRLVLLDPSGATPRLSSTAPERMALALVRHTVASRLFPPTLLVRHLAWSSRIAQANRGWALSYGQVPDNLPVMIDLVSTP